MPQPGLHSVNMTVRHAEDCLVLAKEYALMTTAGGAWAPAAARGLPLSSMIESSSMWTPTGMLEPPDMTLGISVDH